MLNTLYTIIIYPLTQIIEFVLVLSQKVFKETGLSVIAISAAISILTLPLYVVAEKWQQIERDTQKRLKPKLDKIKAVFKGDEQYMILSTYYRQNHYHPIYALRSTFSLFVQIPFFIAAYSYLSSLEVLKGASFLFIHDLGVPDHLANIGSFTVNALPIAMTVLNIIAGAIYTKGFPLKEKVQLYGMAAVFLVLLYNSPAGLVLYWTMNNIFSLIKNIFYKLKDPLKVLYVISCCLVGTFIAYLLLFNDNIFQKRLMLIGASLLVVLIPLYMVGIKAVFRVFLIPLFNNNKQRTIIFITSALALTLLAGICIPAAVIVSSPEEFCFIDPFKSPFPFIRYAFSAAFGLFFFWPVCIYFLCGGKLKTILTMFFSITAVIGVINTFVFPGSYGTILNTFNFSVNSVQSDTVISLFNGLVILLIIGLVLFLLKRNYVQVITSGTGIMFLALTTFSLYNSVQIYSGYEKLAARWEASGSDIHSIIPIFSLSKDKPNVIVVMSDCAINGFVKPIFDEHPRLTEQFDGFTLYPNTLSYAMHTVMGVPPIWGGYEYTPQGMNKRDDVPLVEKHNEALLTLPRLFTGAGFQVFVTDPSWSNYSWTSDISIYEQYPDIHAFNTIGRYSDIWYAEHNFGDGNVVSTRIKRNALWFSLLRIVPPVLRSIVYDDGWYWSPDDIGDNVFGFIDSYSVLDYLPRLTSYDSKESSALFITNNTTHDLTFLQYPYYTPAVKVEDKGNGIFSSNNYYHVNNAFYLKFGEWLDELRKHGVYDNTRIIIVSDHGAATNAHIADTDIPIPGERREAYNPVLLIKDFDAHGELQTDMTFMTNADVPVLATRGIVSEPLINPFTGATITMDPKKEGVYITSSHLMQPMQHSKNIFRIKDDQWIFVHDNIFAPDNWGKVEE